MRLGVHSNQISCEYEMQEHFGKWLKKKGWKYVPELLVPEAHRRPDFLILKNGLVNVEAKCNNLECMLEQLKDNAVYCDYSFAFIPDYCMTPQWFKTAFLKTNFGLIIYNYKTHAITEVLEAHSNRRREEINWDKDLNKRMKTYVSNNSKKVRKKIKRHW